MLKTLDNSLEVLKMFTKEKQTWGGRELATEMNENHTKIYRILETFEKHNFLMKDKETKKYSLGIAIWEIGHLVLDKYKVTDAIRPLLEELSRTTGESVFLTKLENEEGLTLVAVEPDNKVRFSVSVGSRAPLYVGASYRSILAYMSEDFIQDYTYQNHIKYTDNTMVSPKQLNEELQQIREDGYAISYGEYTEDITAIAVPIFLNDEIFGSITISGPTYRIDEEQIQFFIKELQKAEKHLSQAFDRYAITI